MGVQFEFGGEIMQLWGHVAVLIGTLVVFILSVISFKYVREVLIIFHCADWG